MIIFTLWTGFLLLNVALALLGPVIRHDGSVGHEQIPLAGIIGIFVPPLSCLAGFWFPDKERETAKAKNLGKERARAALILTAAYLVLVTILLFWPIYLATYPATLELPQGVGLSDRISDAMTIATMLSPLSLAPIHYLTTATTTGKRMEV